MASLANVLVPHEIWINIFKYLTTSDIVNVCSVSEEHQYLLREKDVIKYFDIGGDFNFYNTDIYKYIKENLEFRYIKTLNINKFYWIPLKDLRYILSYLPNLEELLALDTKLGLRQKDVKAYGKLKKLAITIEAREFTVEPLDIKNNMYLLKKFCLCISMKQEYFAKLYKMFDQLVGLEELWISDTDDSIIEPIKFDYIVFKLKFLKRLVIKSKVNIPFLDYKPFGLAKYFEIRRFKSIVMCYERYPIDAIVPHKQLSIFEPFETEIEAAWEVIHKFNCEMPYGPESAKQFYFTKQIKNVQFGELNFFHNRSFCNPSFIKATLDFLKCENSKNLKKLCIKSCVLQRHPVSKDHTLDNLQQRKYPIIDVIENCKNVKILELMQCTNLGCQRIVNGDTNCNVTILDAYPFISKWSKLEKLTLEVPTHSNGKFLKDVLIFCLKLKYLKVISYGTNENLNISLYEALPYGTSLEDFGLVNVHINIQRIFKSFILMQSCKLRRIYLNATANDSLQFLPIEEFLRTNPQVLFLYIALSDRSQSELNVLQELLNKYKKKDPTRIYFAKKQTRNYVGNFPIPVVHKDLMSCGYLRQKKNMDIFPCELWEQIVKHLAAYDLINFCKSFGEFEYLLRDKHMMINFDLGGCFDFYKENLYDYISLNIGYEHTKYLNINKLYWVNLEDLRNLIKLLPKLEELCALDTKLGMRGDDVILYKKLKKLAVSVEAEQFTSPREVYRENLAALKSFCIKFISKYRADFRQIYYIFFNELRGLNELWLYDADETESQALRYDYIVCNLRKLNKLVIKSKTRLSLLDYKPFGLIKIYGRQRSNITTICYVRSPLPQTLPLRRSSLSQVFESRTLKSWDIIQSFLGETPCSFKNSLDVYKTKSMKLTDFNELTFFHARTCNPTFVNSVIDILLSKHARGLKKLCLALCILQEGNIEQNEKKNIFRHIINNCPNLSELEIVTCSSTDPRDLEAESMKIPCYSSAIIESYELISNLNHLKKLTLDIPAYLNGFFLKDVFLKCPDLQYLQIISKETNEDLNSVVYSHLNYAQRLIDFRFENVHIDLDRLFSALNKVLNSKLRRIVVKCEYEHSVQLWPIKKLLNRNKDIILLAILVLKYNRHQINQLHQLITEYKDHPAKVYIAKTEINPEEDIFIPEAHKDILYYNSDVSVLHLSEF